jgi:serine protease Do
MENRRVNSLTVILVIQTLAFACFGAGQGTNPPATLNIQDRPLDSSRKGLSFAPVVKKVAPSVVNIYSTMTVRQSSSGVFDDPLLRRFFGEDSGRRPREHKAQSLGSGVLVSPEGYILTANHVVESADSVKVAFGSGEKELEARVIGTDPLTDVAVLKIEPRKDLVPVPLTDSDKLEVGDVVLAVGNPFGLGQTVTSGIISGLGRANLGIAGYENFIQTDAAINPGNSGGALVDAEGRLVGINTAILSRTGGNMGVGFAVPVNMARFVMERLIASGKVTRGFLGVGIQPLTSDLAKEFHLPDESSGVLVSEVTPNSAAAKAGLQDGDVIIELNGKKMTDPSNLSLTVAQIPPGSKVSLRVLRGETGRKPSEKTVTAILGELPTNELTSTEKNPGKPNQKSGNDVLEGVEVADINASTRRHFDIPRTLRTGAVISSVDQDSTAAEAGIQEGDIVLEINHQPVHSADEAVTLSEKVKGDHVLLRVWSRAGGGSTGRTRYVLVQNSTKK